MTPGILDRRRTGSKDLVGVFRGLIGRIDHPGNKGRAAGHALGQGQLKVWKAFGFETAAEPVHRGFADVGQFGQGGDRAANRGFWIVKNNVSHFALGAIQRISLLPDSVKHEHPLLCLFLLQEFLRLYVANTNKTTVM